jgi:tetratricopeptide (TPR) repeat protein
VRWLSALLLLLAAAAVALSALEPQLRTSAQASPRRPGLPEGVARSYAQALAQADAEVAGAQALAAGRTSEWLVLEGLARRLAARARLTGSFDDYAAAQAVLDRAFAVAAPGAGPHLAQASLHFSLHRLDAAERQLDLIDRYAVPPDLSERVEALALRGDIAFYRGDYASAARLYREAEALEPGADALAYRWGVFHAHTGRSDLAAEQFDRAIRAARTPLPQHRANVELQKGIMFLERGRLDEAMARFREADAIFPGHWLVEEHIAEVLALTGRTGEAERLYGDIVRRTGHPEFMDQLAALARRRGDAQAAQAWTARAGAEWERRLKLLPEAAYGHALDHYLAAGDPQRALGIARANLAARPHGEAQVALAEALLAAGQPQAARDTVAEVLRSRWRTPDTHAVAARVFEANGLPRLAAREHARLEALRRDL